MSIGIVPISSRKSVPPFAMSKYPFFAVSAPVKAPFSCPNRRDAGKFAWQRSAIDRYKLAVTSAVRVNALCHGLLAGTVGTEYQHRHIRRGYYPRVSLHLKYFRAGTSEQVFRFRADSRERTEYLFRQFKQVFPVYRLGQIVIFAPNLMARTASGIDPYSVVTMNGMSFFSFVSHSKSDIPSPSGKRTSDNMKSNRCLRINARAAGSRMAVITSYPACSSQSFWRCDKLILSSTISTFCFIAHFLYFLFSFCYKSGDVSYQQLHLFIDGIHIACRIV